jgi:DNA-binding SARP family transcriptional activator/Tfp pilus assembly protein PilF
MKRGGDSKYRIGRIARGVVVEFRVLGPIEFWAAEKQFDFRSAKERHLLAILLLAGGRPVPVDVLIDRLWGETPPAEVRQSLQADIHRLRRMFRAAGVSDRARIATKSGAYALEVDPDCVDLFRCQSLREQARAIRESGDIQAAATLLREALSLWRSDPLTGLKGEWFDHMRTSLDGSYRVMAQELVEVEFAAGNHAEVVGFLVELIDRYPLDQTFVGQLMLAYYRCGRQADAIDLYFDAMHRLREETGTDPEPRLRALHRNIQRHDPSLAPPRPAFFGGPPGPDRLPAPAAAFTGRARDLAELAAGGASQGGIVAIEGMPGVGKTALAVKLAHELAEHFPDARLHLHLHAHDPQRPPQNPAAALSELLRAVGVAPRDIPRELTERVQLWHRVMEGRRALILLDDAADSSQVRPLLPGNPDCQVIITARRHLTGIDRIRHYRLPVLPDEDAATLFLRIAASDTALPPAEVSEVVRLCGGLPLVLGQAATRLRDKQVSSIETLIENLRRPYEDIADLPDPVLSRAFDLSCRCLPLNQRRIFRRMGLSPASELTAPAVAVLADIPVADAEQSLSDFVNHYLLEEIALGRYQMHDLIRQHARMRAMREDSPSDRRRAVSRTLDYYLGRAYLADRMLYPHHEHTDVTIIDQMVEIDGFNDEEAAMDWLRDERKNLFHLVQYASNYKWNSHVIDFARTVARYFDSVALWEEAEVIQRLALKVALRLDLPQAVARTRLNLSVILWRMGQVDEPLTETTLVRDIARRTQNPILEAAALDQIGLVKWSCSNYREALAYFAEAHDIYRENGYSHGAAESLNHVGMMLAQTGRLQEALHSFEDALEIYESIGDKRGVATTLSNLANTYLQLGSHQDAYKYFRRSQDIYHTLPGRRNQAILKNNLGDVERYRGNLNSALKYYREALAEYGATGDRINESNALNNVGITFYRMDRYNEALIHHKRALSIADQIGNTSEKIRAHLGIADIEVSMGRYPAAAEKCETALRLGRTIGDPQLEAQALTSIAHVTTLTRGHDAARIYWRQAYNLFYQMGITPEIEAARLHLQPSDLANF